MDRASSTFASSTVDYRRTWANNLNVILTGSDPEDMDVHIRMPAKYSAAGQPMELTFADSQQAAHM
eukprot:12414042-Karenia_brevis.AAC.1